MIAETSSIIHSFKPFKRIHLKLKYSQVCIPEDPLVVPHCVSITNFDAFASKVLHYHSHDDNLPLLFLLFCVSQSKLCVLCEEFCVYLYTVFILALPSPHLHTQHTPPSTHPHTHTHTYTHPRPIAW